MVFFTDLLQRDGIVVILDILEDRQKTVRFFIGSIGKYLMGVVPQKADEQVHEVTVHQRLIVGAF